MPRAFLFILGTALFFGGFSFAALRFTRVVEVAPAKAQISEIISPLLENKSATLIFTGDIMLNRRVEMMMRANANYRFPFPAFLAPGATLSQQSRDPGLLFL